jgi:hypothetical protein
VSTCNQFATAVLIVTRSLGCHMVRDELWPRERTRMPRPLSTDTIIGSLASSSKFQHPCPLLLTRASIKAHNFIRAQAHGCHTPKARRTMTRVHKEATPISPLAAATQGHQSASCVHHTSSSKDTGSILSVPIHISSHDTHLLEYFGSNPHTTTSRSSSTRLRQARSCLWRSHADCPIHRPQW